MHCSRDWSEPRPRSFYVDALVAAGTSRVYAGARTPSSVKNSHGVPVELDITNIAQVEAAALTCRDVMLLINNAGILMNSPMLSENSPAAMRKEFDVNVFGTLNMINAFAPIPAVNALSQRTIVAHHLSARISFAESMSNASFPFAAQSARACSP